MPVIICSACTKSWMDTKYAVCPECGTPAGVNGSDSRAAGPATAQTQPSSSQYPGPANHMPPVGPHSPMTKAHAERIIQLLEERSTRRVDVVSRAVSASNLLEVLATIVLVLGGIGVLIGAITIFTTGLGSGLLFIVIALASTAAYWASLTVASVVAGYVANRSGL